MDLGYQFESGDVIIFLTLLLLEGVLSFDNAAVLAAMVRRLPEHQRRKALMYGLGGAYVFRIAAIVGVAYIIANPYLKLVGGLYLVWLAFKHLVLDRRVEERPPSMFERMGFSGFWGVVIAVELADVAFALDQVLAAVALTDKLPLIIAASLIAILFLRIAAGYMTRLMDWFPQLETLAYLAVAFVGLKLVVVDVAHRIGYEAFDVPKQLSVSVTFSLLVVPVVAKWLWDVTRRKDAPAA